MLFPILLFAYLLSQFYRAFLAVMAVDLTRDLGLDAAALGSLSGAFLFAFALAQFPTGTALDRFGPRRSLGGGLLFAVAGALLLACATGYGGAVAAFALIGTGCAPVLMAGIYVAARLYSLEGFATFSSLLIGFGTLGDPLSGVPLALANSAFGWRVTMVAMAAVTLLCALVVWRFMPQPPSLSAPADGKRPGIATILRLRALWPLLPLVCTSYAVAVATRGLWVSPYLETVHGFGQGAVSAVATAMGFAMGAGALLYAAAARAVGAPKPTVLAGASLCAVCFAALAAFGDRSAPLAVALLLGAVATGVSYAILMAHARAFMPDAAIGRGVTVMNFFFMGGGGALQWLSGIWVHSAETRGLPTGTIYAVLFGGFAALLIVALATYVLARPARVTASA